MSKISCGPPLALCMLTCDDGLGNIWTQPAQSDLQTAPQWTKEMSCVRPKYLAPKCETRNLKHLTTQHALLCTGYVC